VPGWPSVGRADDQRLVEALCRADSRAADGLYDAYADRLNDYACSLLHDTDAAADSVHDAIVTAHGRAGLLREPARLRAWLYALTRFQCTARRGRTPAHGAAPEAFLEGDEDDPELAAIVREALAELGQKERDALLLSLRHELTASEIGAVLGLTSRQAGSRLARARDHLENAAAAVILARTGRAHCPDLSALLDSIEGPLPQQLRRRLTRHIIACKECTEGRHRRVSAERLLDVMPVGFPPLSLRRRVAETCAKPEHDAARASIMAVAELFDKNGFPPVGAERRARSERRSAKDGGRAPLEQAQTIRFQSAAAHGETPRSGAAVAHADTPRHGTRAAYGDTPRHGTRAAYAETPGAKRAPGGKRMRKASRRSTPVFATIACVLVATGAMVVATGQDTSKPGGPTQTLRFPSHTPGELQISYGPQPTDDASEPSSTPSDSASPKKSPPGTGATAPARPTAVPRSPAARASTRPPAPTPAARLVVSCPGGLGDESSGVILVSARNATVAWRATATGGLTVSPAQGVLKSGVKARLSVTILEPGEAGQGGVSLRSAAGGTTCQVSWNAQDPPPESDPPPDEHPTSDPSASDTPSEQSSSDPT
jgi:RNA polymerase sigma factor (sigma-70 family)